MTIKEYFENEQPVNDAVYEKDGIYTTVQTVTFKYEEQPDLYINIQVARADEDIWAFGWEVCDGAAERTYGRDCSSCVVTKGNIRVLMYGVTKAVLYIILKTKHSKAIRALAESAVGEAEKYCTAERTAKGNTSVGKITI